MARGPGPPVRQERSVRSARPPGCVAVTSPLLTGSLSLHQADRPTGAGAALSPGSAAGRPGVSLSGDGRGGHSVCGHQSSHCPRCQGQHCSRFLPLMRSAGAIGRLRSPLPPARSRGLAKRPPAHPHAGVKDAPQDQTQRPTQHRGGSLSGMWARGSCSHSHPCGARGSSRRPRVGAATAEERAWSPPGGEERAAAHLLAWAARPPAPPGLPRPWFPGILGAGRG